MTTSEYALEIKQTEPRMRHPDAGWLLGRQVRGSRMKKDSHHYTGFRGN